MGTGCGNIIGGCLQNTRRGCAPVAMPAECNWKPAGRMKTWPGSWCERSPSDVRLCECAAVRGHRRDACATTWGSLMFEFLNPLLFGGLAAVAAPLIIHLLHRRKVKQVDWGAMRFLAELIAQQRRRLFLEELLLLLVRALL